MKIQGVERLGGLKPVNPTSNKVVALTRAYALLKDRRRWCKGSYALYGNSKYPVAFCAAGAVNRYGYGRSFLNEAAGNREIVDVNDNPKTGHSRILAIFRKAIKLAKERQ